MDDLISREASIRIIKNAKYPKTDIRTSFDLGRNAGLEFASVIVEGLPTAEPKRGRWIEDKGQQTLMQNFIERGEVWRVCSVCGAGHMIGHKYECDKAYHETYHNFCPNCGAKMEVNHESD